MGEAVRIYAEKLQTLGHGHPLWWPEHIEDLYGRKREVQIGDVGYVDEDGGLNPLFNIFRPGSNERDEKCTLPQGFQVAPFDFSICSVDTKVDYLPPGLLHSSSVKSRRISGGLSTNDPITNTAGASVAYNLVCESGEGAFLLLWDSATKTTLKLGRPQFEKYILEHHDSWCEYARSILGISAKDIIVVSGFIKSSTWTIATFFGDSRFEEGTVGGHLASALDVDFSHPSGDTTACLPIGSRSGPAHRLKSAQRLASREEPEDRAMPKDQCLFLNYYKVKHRSLAPEPTTSSGYDDDSGHSDEDEGEKYLVTVPPHIDHCNPLDIILDYILESSDAEVALVSHDDLDQFTLDDQWPSTFADYLRSVAPKIVTDNKVGRLRS